MLHTSLVRNKQLLVTSPFPLSDRTERRSSSAHLQKQHREGQSCYLISIRGNLTKFHPLVTNPTRFYSLETFAYRWHPPETQWHLRQESSLSTLFVLKTRTLLHTRRTWMYRRVTLHVATQIKCCKPHVTNGQLLRC